MNTLNVKPNPIAMDLTFADDSLHVTLADGRIISVPLEWFPRLKNADKTQRENWRFIGNGMGIHWEEIDEDISVASLLRLD